MKLFVTVLEDSLAAALAVVRGIGQDHDGVEIRVERFREIDYDALRRSTAKPILLTWRNLGGKEALGQSDRALAAGIDLIDVEWSAALDRAALEPYAHRVVLSHHDFDSLGDIEAIQASMEAMGCAWTKLAVTPRTLADNFRLLTLLERGGTSATVIGMGERGLYSRVLAPFRGSAFAFVSAGKAAAPGQLTLALALDIYGPDRSALRAERTFAVAGNPAGHSLSPSIHNHLFREKGVSAAYTIASVESFAEVAEALSDGQLTGVSVTAPFKEDALRFAESQDGAIGRNAMECGAVNTLVRTAVGLVADNTDVDGFEAILRQVCGRDSKSVAVVGAGATARAARVAADRAGMHVTLFNRTAGKLGALPLAELSQWDGEVLIDTTPADLDLPLRPGMTYIRAAYGSTSEALRRAADSGAQSFDGVDLLEAQAVRQHELFMRAFDES